MTSQWKSDTSLGLCVYLTQNSKPCSFLLQHFKLKSLKYNIELKNDINRLICGDGIETWGVEWDVFFPSLGDFGYECSLHIFPSQDASRSWICFALKDFSRCLTYLTANKEMNRKCHASAQCVHSFCFEGHLDNKVCINSYAKDIHLLIW